MLGYNKFIEKERRKRKSFHFLSMSGKGKKKKTVEEGNESETSQDVVEEADTKDSRFDRLFQMMERMENNQNKMGNEIVRLNNEMVKMNEDLRKEIRKESEKQEQQMVTQREEIQSEEEIRITNLANAIGLEIEKLGVDMGFKDAQMDEEVKQLQAQNVELKRIIKDKEKESSERIFQIEKNLLRSSQKDSGPDSPLITPRIILSGKLPFL